MCHHHTNASAAAVATGGQVRRKIYNVYIYIHIIYISIYINIQIDRCYTITTASTAAINALSVCGLWAYPFSRAAPKVVHLVGITYT